MATTAIVVVGGREISVEDAKNMKKYSSLVGRSIYQIRSTKVVDGNTESPKLYGVVSTFIEGIEYISAKQSADGAPRIILNPGKENKEIILPVATNPFKTIDKSAAMRKGFTPEEGYYTDRDDVYTTVAALNAGTKALLNEEIAQRISMVEIIETAMESETLGLKQEKELEALLNA